MVATFIVVVVALLILAVVFAPDIKAYAHKEESAVGAKLKADIAKVVPKVPGV